MVLPIVAVKYASSPKPSKHGPNADRERHRPLAPCHIQTIIGGFIRGNTANGSDRIEIKRGRPAETYREHGTLAAIRRRQKEEFSGG